MTTKRTALVISGGTARGAYAAGLVEQLFRRFPDLARSIDLYSATSTGALIAPALALYRLTGEDQLLDLIVDNYRVDSTAVWRSEPASVPWRVVRWLVARLTSDAELARMVSMLGETGASLDTAPLEQVIARAYGHWLPRLLAGRDEVEVLVNTVSAQSGGLEVFSSRNRNMTAPLFQDAIYASCLQPLLMPLKRMPGPPPGGGAGAAGAGEPLHELMDGGIRDVVPIDAAVAAGATRVLAISLFPEKAPLPPYRQYGGRDNLPALVSRVVLDLLNSEVQEDDLLQGRLLSALGRLVLWARARHVSEAELQALLSDLTGEERARLLGKEIFSSLYVHRPAVPQIERLTWTAAEMQASIEAGQAVARGPEGERMAEFLRGEHAPPATGAGTRALATP